MSFSIRKNLKRSINSKLDAGFLNERKDLFDLDLDSCAYLNLSKKIALKIKIQLFNPILSLNHDQSNN